MSNSRSYFWSGFLGALAVILVALKLLGVVDLPWPIVLMPLWAPFAMAGILLLTLFLTEAARGLHDECGGGHGDR